MIITMLRGDASYGKLLFTYTKTLEKDDHDCLCNYNNSNITKFSTLCTNERMDVACAIKVSKTQSKSLSIDAINAKVVVSKHPVTAITRPNWKRKFLIRISSYVKSIDGLVEIHISLCISRYCQFRKRKSILLPRGE